MDMHMDSFDESASQILALACSSHITKELFIEEPSHSSKGKLPYNDHSNNLLSAELLCSQAWSNNLALLEVPRFGSILMGYDAFGNLYLCSDNNAGHFPGLRRHLSTSTNSIDDLNGSWHKSKTSLSSSASQSTLLNSSPSMKIPDWVQETASAIDSEQHTLSRPEHPELQTVWEKHDTFRQVAERLTEYKTQIGSQALVPHRWSPQFRRSRRVLEQEGVAASRRPDAHGNYLGDVMSRSYRTQHSNLANSENCALFITNIPNTADYPDIFAVVSTGSVFCLHINPHNEVHPMKAAKLAFTTPSAAADFMAQVRSGHGVRILGQRIKAVYNRHGYREYEYRKIKSRVLRITGPADLMSLEFWDSYFRHCAVVQWQLIQEVHSDRPGLKIMEFFFARIDAQAEACYEAIKRDEHCQGVYDVRYWYDPCDPNPSYYWEP